ncbi:MAG: phosphoglycerate dehydrogenase [Anaerolineae bacterium]|nr:phosphoglycerate dehydrogenase [Anaerolineae bacterium]
MTTDLKSYRVLVTPTSYARHDPTLRTTLEAAVGEVVYNERGVPFGAEDLLSLLPGFDGYIAGLDTISRAVIEAADRLKVIARYGVGVDRVDLEAARARGIVVTNTPGANTVSVAELTVGLMLSLARMIPTANRATKAGEWPRLSGLSIEGKVIGLLGLGAIGSAVAARLRGFDCAIIGYDPAATEAEAAAHGVALKSRAVVIAQADFLTLHVPVLPETAGMVDAAFIDQMKPGAYLINTARGELIDEAALLAALESGKLCGAALDTFQKEPPGADHPLFRLPQVIATPHTGAHSDGAINAMGRMALHDCLAVLRGKTPKHRVV